MTTMKTVSNINRIFMLLALCILAAGMYHLYAAIDPTAVPTQSFAEHVFWVFANSAACYFLIKRTKFFTPVLVLWVLQQWYYHGGMAVSIWNEHQVIAYLDIGVVFFMPGLLALYWWDTKEKDAAV